MDNHGKDLLKGALAGLVAGLVATAAKTAAEAIYPPHVQGEAALPQGGGSAVLGPQFFALSKLGADGATSQNWAFGALAGAAYGALAEVYPQATDRHGASFGLMLAAVAHDGVLPALGLAAAPEAEHTGREHKSELASHIVYGVVAETVRSTVRRLL